MKIFTSANMPCKITSRMLVLIHQKSKAITILLLFITFSLSLISQPSITSFSPTHGPIGTIVEITGTGFNLNPASNAVFFGTIRANVISTSSTNIEVTVPYGATYDYISVTDLTTGLTAYSSIAYGVTFPFCSEFTNSSYTHNLDMHFEPFPYNALSSDFDGDGLSDILLTKYGGQITISRNTSSIANISFEPYIILPASDYPWDAVISDFNGDGKPDIVIANDRKTSISYYKNISTKGNILFAPKVEKEVWHEPRSIAVGDIDTDGKPDLVIAYSSIAYFSVFRNTSTNDSISFAFSANIDSQEGGDIVVSDLDGDNKPDIIRHSYFEKGTSLYLNTSETEVSFSFVGKLLEGKTCENLLSCDLNADGKNDLIIDYYWPESLGLFKNTSTIGNISFDSCSSFPSITIKEMAIADVDGNGSPDINAIAWEDSVFSVYLNSSTVDELVLEPQVEFSKVWSANSISVADFDLDGRPDFVIPNEYYNTYEHKISVYRNYAIPPPPEICMVTVDSTSTNNIIYWDNSLYTGVDSMIVYRETTSNNYKRIGAKKIGSINYLIDTARQLYFPYTGDPNIGSYRYKLQRIDTCGAYSELGPYHNTIYIANNGGTFNWNHYEIEGLPIPIPQMEAYHLLRKKTETGLAEPWELIGGVASSQSTINDPDYDKYPNALRKVETQWSINCSNDRENHSSYSNIIGVSISGISDNGQTKNADVVIYPNPFKYKATVQSKEKLYNATIRIYNAFGLEVKQRNGISGNTFSIYSDNLKSGMYFILLSDEHEIIAKKKIMILD